MFLWYGKSLTMEDRNFMQRAIELALLAEQEGNLPVGSVITLDGNVIAEGRNAIRIPGFDATRHAEMEALRVVPPASWPSSARMTIYTTLEPCIMCMGAIMLHGIGSVVFGSRDDFGGGGSVLPHLPTFFRQQNEAMRWIGPIMPDECDPLHQRLLRMEDPGRGMIHRDGA
jgi:tRNA(adenine34) deaminase